MSQWKPMVTPYVNTSQNIAEQTEVTYQNYRKIGRYADPAYAYGNYIISGGEAAKNEVINNQLDVSDIIASLNFNVNFREGVSFITTFPNSTYYLDFVDGDFHFDTTHPQGTKDKDYLTLAEVTTDGDGMITTVTDKREVIGGIKANGDVRSQNNSLDDVADRLAEAEDYISGLSIIANKSGVAGDGVTDDTSTIQTLINLLASRGGGELLFLQGTYLITAPLSLGDNITLRGIGEKSVFIQDQTKSDGHAFINIRTKRNVIVRDLVFDGKIAERSSVTSAASGIHIIEGSSKCLLDNLIMRNLGNHSLEGGGNHITISTVQNKGDSYDNIVQNCVLDDTNGQSKFGIRLFTEWSIDIPAESYTDFVRDNLIKNNRLIGFAWNSIEVAGPAAIKNKIESNTAVDHVGYAGIEADKGASYNTFTNNFVYNIINPKSRTYNQYGYRDQGSPGNGAYPDRYATGNIWTNNFFDTMTSDPDRTNGAMITSRSRDCVIQGFNARNISAPSDQVNSAAIVVENTYNLTVTGGNFKDINTGIYAINNLYGLNVSNTVFQIKGRGFTPAGGSGSITEDVTFIGNKFYGGVAFVQLQRGDGHNISTNLIKDVSATPISVYANATANVSNNEVFHLSGDAIRFWADNFHVAVGNRIVGGARLRVAGDTNTVVAANSPKEE